MKAMIFGANGQDGFYLSELLKKVGCQIIPVSRNGECLVHADVADFTAVRDLVIEHQPSFIFHFAANSTTRHSALFENHAAISTGTFNILESVRRYSPATKVFISGSGLQFKNTGQPIGERDPFEARDAYSVCRIQSVFAARYFRTVGMKVYVGYFFNHDSPKRSERHLTKKITEFVKSVTEGNTARLVVGDLDVRKEWGFAGDIVEAAWALINQDEFYEATIGTGAAYSILDFIKICFFKINKDWRNHITVSSEFQPEYATLVSDPSTIMSLGWKPRTSIDQLAEMMLNH